MTTIWLDGFDHYNSETDMVNGNYLSASNCSRNTATVRTGTASCRMNDGPAGSFRKTLTPANKYVAGLGLQQGGVGGDQSQKRFGFEDIGNQFFGVGYGLNGFPRLQYNGVTVWDATEQLVFAGAFYYFEVGVVIDNSGGGSIELRINGIPVVIVSGLSNPEQLNELVCTNGNGFAITYADDLYIDDNDFLGAQRCYTSFVNADETPQDWTLSSGVNAYDLLDNVPYSAANYIEAANIGDQSKFAFTDLPSLNAIVNACRLSGVQALDLAGSGETTMSLDFNDGDVRVGSAKALSTSPVFYNDVFDISGKSISEINGASIIIEKVS